MAFSTPDASALILNLLAKRTGQPLINAMTIVWIYIIFRKTLNYINGNISQQKNIYKCKYHNLLSGQIRFKYKSNTTNTNYFITFLQNVDVSNFLLVLF